MSRQGTEIRDSKHRSTKQAPSLEIVPIEGKPLSQYFEAQAKFIQDRITNVEKNFGQMCETFSSYVRKTARLRDKGDQVCKDLVQYVDGETLNPSAKEHYTDLAQNLSAIQDYRNAQVTRLEAKVQQPLSNYGLKCKHTKSDLKAAFSARDRENKIRKKLEVARNKGDTRQVATLETDLKRASVDASRTTKNLEQQMDKFELEKLQDAKKIMSDFVMIEMAFHAKALEVYSQCFQNLSTVSVDQDIREFRAKMRPSNSAARKNLVRAGSLSSIESSTAYEDTPRVEQQGGSPVRPQPRATPNGIRGRPQEDDDDDDDEDDDEEDDDDESYETDEEETEAETSRVQAVKPAQRR